jgi:hypothetical protein
MSLRNAIFANVLFLAWLLPAAQAAEPVLMPRAMGMDASVDPAMVPAAGCPWGEEAAGEIERTSKGTARITDLKPAEVPGRYFVVEVTSLHMNIGHVGTKRMRARGRMLEGGKEIGAFEFHGSTGFDAGKTCPQVTYLGRRLGRNIGKWLHANGQLPTAQLAAKGSAAKSGPAPAQDAAAAPPEE